MRSYIDNIFSRNALFTHLMRLYDIEIATLLVIIPLYSMSPEIPHPSTQLLTLLCSSRLPLPIFAKVYMYKTFLECYDQSNYLDNNPYLKETINFSALLCLKHNRELLSDINHMKEHSKKAYKQQEVIEISAAMAEAKLQFYKNNEWRIYTEKDRVNDFFYFNRSEDRNTLLQMAAQELSVEGIRTLVHWGANPNTKGYLYLYRDKKELVIPLTLVLQKSFRVANKDNTQDIVQIINLLNPEKANWHFVDKPTLNQAFNPRQYLPMEIRLALIQHIPDDVLKELYEKYRTLSYIEREYKEESFKPMRDAFLARKKLMYPEADSKKSRNYAIKRQIAVNQRVLPPLVSHISPTVASKE